MTQLDISVLQKARDYVNDQSLSAVELLSLLRKARKEKHPDKFPDEGAKAKAEEDAKTLNALITDLDKYLQNQKAQQKPQELILFQGAHQLAEAERAVDALEAELAELKQSNEHLNSQVADLSAQLAEKAKLELAEEDAALRDFYRPKKGTYFTAGIFVALSLLIPVFSKIDEISKRLALYSPFPPQYINGTAFLAFLIALAATLKKVIEAHYIGERADTVSSPQFAYDFFRYATTHRAPGEKQAYFLESEAHFYISIQPHKVMRALVKFGFKGASDQANTRLTALFINTLLEKKLINISYAENLDRRFLISTRPTYHQ